MHNHRVANRLATAAVISALTIAPLPLPAAPMSEPAIHSSATVQPPTVGGSKPKPKRSIRRVSKNVAGQKAHSGSRDRHEHDDHYFTDREARQLDRVIREMENIGRLPKRRAFQDFSFRKFREQAPDGPITD